MDPNAQPPGQAQANAQQQPAGQAQPPGVQPVGQNPPGPEVPPNLDPAVAQYIRNLIQAQQVRAPVPALRPARKPEDMTRVYRIKSPIEEDPILLDFIDDTTVNPPGTFLVYYPSTGAALPADLADATTIDGRLGDISLPIKYEDLSPDHSRKLKEEVRRLNSQIRRLGDQVKSTDPVPLQLPEGNTGGAGEHSHAAKVASDLSSTLLPLARLLLLGMQPGVVPISLLQHVALTCLADFHRAASELTLTAQLYRAAGETPISKDFVQQVVRDETNLAQKRQTVRDEIARQQAAETSKALQAVIRGSRGRGQPSNSDAGPSRGRGNKRHGRNGGGSPSSASHSSSSSSSSSKGPAHEDSRTEKS